MNYLAHAFLSGTDTELLIGNFIADGVRGKQILNFSEGIQQGILLHRRIDAFTDAHETVTLTKNRLRPTYGKFAPVIADMFYDHFLGAEFQQFSDQPLKQFSEHVYEIMMQHYNIMPEKVKHFLPHMVQHNWLLGYAEIEGIKRALTGLSRRAKFQSGMETATIELQQNYELYKQEFIRFFPELIAFVNTNRNLYN